jgi:uroporphyrinogen decarboxylase
MGKQLLIDVLNHIETPRPAWVPFVGIHAGKFKGYPPRDVLTDSSKLVECLLEMIQIYVPDAIPVMFDLQLEAEILGCALKWSDDSLPSVISHPLKDNSMIPEDVIPTILSGRLGVMIDATKELKKVIKGEIALYGLICGPFTLASHLRGTDLFIDFYDDETYVDQLIAYCNRFIKHIIQLYVKAGIDVIALVDPLVSQISPVHFKQFLSNPFTELFAYIKDAGVKSSFFVCGDASKNIEVMCETKPDSISVDENINLAQAKEITDRYGIVIGGNIPLTTMMLHGTQLDNMKYVIDLMDRLPNNRSNLIISPGCDMPYDVPIENGIGVAQAVIDDKFVKQMVENHQMMDYSTIKITLPNYDKLEKPLIEVFTLDSLSCAACSYMMHAVMNATVDLKDTIDVVEYKYTIKENIARCIQMGVKNLPSVYINGKLMYSSIIPYQNELKEYVASLMKGYSI